MRIYIRASAQQRNGIATTLSHPSQVRNSDLVVVTTSALRVFRSDNLKAVVQGRPSQSDLSGRGRL